jgi:hypothetical protein
MSDEPKKRETIVALSGAAHEGNAWLLAARLDSQIEIAVTEEKGADSSVLLSKAQAIDLARILMVALDQQPSFPRFFKCCDYDQPATCHMTEVQNKGEPITFHLCEQHARPHHDQTTRKPPEP